MSSSSMRGLTVFVSDIRNCSSKEAEDKRVQKELANIRLKFTGTKAVKPYDRRKYMWKLVYIYMMGYEFDFGHQQITILISAATPTEKQVGYIAASVLFTSDDESIHLILETIRHDLHASNEAVQCMALSALANIGGDELCSALVSDVYRLLTSRASPPTVRKKAALCMLRIYRVKPSLVPVEEWAGQLMGLLDDKSLGVVLCAVTLTLGLASSTPDLFKPYVPHVITVLTRLALNNLCSSDYLYYSTANPWLQVKLLQLLHLFPVPADEAHRARLNDVLTKIVTHTEVTKSVNKNNADHSVLFEAVNLIIRQGADSDPVLRGQAVELLGRFLAVREPNIRYLGLETLARLAALEGTGDAIREHQDTVLACLKEQDVSIRLRALDLLFAMCNEKNAMPIVEELLVSVVTADYRIKAEMMLKIAILAERHAPSLNWYVDTVLRMISCGGSDVDDAIWHRVVQIITNNEDLQQYAAKQLYVALLPESAPAVIVKIGTYVLGEFGATLEEEEGMSPQKQFNAIQSHFAAANADTRAIMLTAYAKMFHFYPSLRENIKAVFDSQSTVMNAELQQRAVEYLGLPNLSTETLEHVLSEMPEYTQENSVLEELNKARRAGNSNEKDFAPATGKAAATPEEDEDDDDDSTEDERKAAAPAPAQTTGSLLDMEGAAAPAPAPPMGGAPMRTVTISPELKPKLLAWFNRFAVADGGVLYEDDVVQIGCKLGKTAPTGTVSLFFGNKTGNPLNSLKVRVPGNAGLAAEVQAVPPTIAAGQQAQVVVNVACAMPFNAPLPLQISFLSAPNVGHALALRLPSLVTHFITPIPLPFADYTKRWGALAGEEKAIMQAADASTVNVAWASEFLKNLGFSIVEADGEAAARAAHGAGLLRTTTVRNGQAVSVGVLVRLDCNTKVGAFRLVVKAQAPQLGAAIKTIAALHLGKVVG